MVWKKFSWIINRDRRIAAAEFDAEFYLNSYPDVKAAKVDPLRHFLEHGWRELRMPNSEFSTTAYLKNHPELVRTDVNPFLHYLRSRSAESEFYNAEDNSENDNINQFEVTPPAHSDSGQDQQSPEHGETASSDGEEREFSDPEVAHNQFVYDTVVKHFDEKYYRNRYGNMIEPDEDPVSHYLREGWLRGNDPTSSFSTKYYLRRYDDVRQAGVNPFYHYLAAGKREGRETQGAEAWQSDIVKTIRPLSERCQDWSSGADAARALDSHNLAQALEGAGILAAPKIVLSFSHDNYPKHTGGVQLALMVEQVSFTSAGWRYLHLSPAVPLPTWSRKDELPGRFAYHINVDGHEIGISTCEDLISALRRRTRNCQLELIFHALQGHSPETLLYLAKSLNVNHAYYWVHDYFSICPGYTLLRNDVAFCAAPPPESQACSICVYGDERRRTLSSVKALFNDLAITVLAPSTRALELWNERAFLPSLKRMVIPHGRLIDRTRDKFGGDINYDFGSDRVIRIAFLGYPVAHKGWNVFERLINDFGDDSRYEFFQFGTISTPEVKLRHVPVTVSAADRNAMASSLRREKVDVAIIWSIWPETFSFTAHEAAAAGAYILTSNESGNILPLIKSIGCGLALEKEQHLYDLFTTGRIRDLVSEYARLHKGSYAFDWSRVTAEVLTSEDKINVG